MQLSQSVWALTPIAVVQEDITLQGEVMNNTHYPMKAMSQFMDLYISIIMTCDII